MRSALAKVPGVKASDITIDNTKKTATIALDGVDDPTPEQLCKIFEGTKFSAQVVTS